MGGAKAIAEALARKAKTVKSAQLTTWLLGLAVFFDDYANSLIVGPIMRPVTDKLGVSREKLAFVIDATAAPIAGLAIISTWIGLEVGLIGDALKSVGIQADGFGVFLETIPYRFYNILILAFVVISASGQGAEYWRAGRRRNGICESRCVFGRTACLHVRRKKSVIGVMHFFVLVALVPVLFWREFVYFFKHFNKSAGTGKTTFF